MGTSKSIDLPSGTNWSSTKNKFSRATRKISENSDNPKIFPLMKGFVQSSGGSKSYKSGGSGFGNSKAVVSAGHKLSSFVSEIANAGVEETFEKYFGENLNGKSISEICLELTDFLCDQTSYTNSTDAKSAMYELLQELLNDAKDESDVEEIFENSTNDEDLTDLVERYFGYYVIEQIKRSFYGTLEKKYGAEPAKKLLEDQIKTFALERTREESKTKNIMETDFSDPKSYKFIEDILQEVISIFE